jgi:hypothetical protein
MIPTAQCSHMPDVGHRPSPEAIACRFLCEIETDPAYWPRRLAQEAFDVEQER